MTRSEIDFDPPPTLFEPGELRAGAFAVACLILVPCAVLLASSTTRYLLYAAAALVAWQLIRRGGVWPLDLLMVVGAGVAAWLGHGWAAIFLAPLARAVFRGGRGVLLGTAAALVPVAWVYGTLRFVVPVFEEIFMNIGADLPLPTVVLINVADLASGPATALLAIALLVSVGEWLATTARDQRAVAGALTMGLALGAATLVSVALMLPLVSLVQ